MAYVQHRAGHSQSAITERYIHAAQVLFPGAAARGEARIFGDATASEPARDGHPANPFATQARGPRPPGGA